MQHVLPDAGAKDQEYVLLMMKTLKAANTFMRTLFHSGIWLLDGERDSLIANGLQVLSCFKRLASIAYVRGATRWKLQPKYHFYFEQIYALIIERADDLPSLNPMSTGTQLDEDFVGRMASHSRTVSGRTIHFRTVEKYLLELCLNW